MVVSQKQLQDIVEQYNKILEKIEARLDALEKPKAAPKATPKKAS
jgi:hypothetical protein